MNYLSSCFSSSPVEAPSPLSGLRDLKIPPDFIKKMFVFVEETVQGTFSCKTEVRGCDGGSP